MIFDESMENSSFQEDDIMISADSRIHSNAFIQDHAKMLAQNRFNAKIEDRALKTSFGHKSVVAPKDA
jgi:hypothetical protein